MSRIGKMPIPIPSVVDVQIEGRTVRVKGPKGELSRTFHAAVEIARVDGTVEVRRRDPGRVARALPGL